MRKGEVMNSFGRPGMDSGWVTVQAGKSKPRVDHIVNIARNLPNFALELHQPSIFMALNVE